jgi:8-oxo-dGTP diphosphatase
MAIYLVRHAKAGDRSKWDGDDHDRPLSKKGWAQAHALADRLPSLNGGVNAVVSSPLTRCVQTVEPIAEVAGTKVVTDVRLMEGGRFEEALALLDEVPDGAVVCSHGDVIPDVVHALVRRGMQVSGGPDWRKASTWVLERDRLGHWTAGHAIAPPQPD